MSNYDEKLIKDARIYFSHLYGREISDEEACSWLDSLVAFFNSLS